MSNLDGDDDNDTIIRWECVSMPGATGTDVVRFPAGLEKAVGTSCRSGATVLAVLTGYKLVERSRCVVLQEVSEER